MVVRIIRLFSSLSNSGFSGGRGEKFEAEGEGEPEAGSGRKGIYKLEEEGEGIRVD